MNNELIKNWNSKITENDNVYILGDLMYEKSNGFEANDILKYLFGKKYLIKGNNDKFIDDKMFNKNSFEWIKDYFVLEYGSKKLILFHYPIFFWEEANRSSIHLYGHLHNTFNEWSAKQSEIIHFGKNAFNVGVDVNNYFPVSIDEILNRIK